MLIPLQRVEEWYVKADLLDIIMWVEKGRPRFGFEHEKPYALPSAISEVKPMTDVSKDHFPKVNSTNIIDSTRLMNPNPYP